MTEQLVASSKTTPMDSDSPTTSDTSNRRVLDRKVVRDRCTVLVSCPSSSDGTRSIGVWTQDCSPTGVRFRCMERLEQSSLFIELDGLDGQVVGIEIVRFEELASNHFEYGARFTGIADRETAIQQLMLTD